MAQYELELVEWLRRRPSDHPAVKLGIGDDMALLNLPSGRVLVSSDMLLDGVHFDARRHRLAQVGRKAVACCLSDCAAMAVCPVSLTVSVALSQSYTVSDARELLDGVFSMAAQFDVAVVGGDTTRWGHPLAIDVSVIAVPYEGVEPVMRSGAKPGDSLYVTGPLGGSLRGRHLTFTPRIREAQLVAEALGERLHAMIDISDGLSLDLWRLCQASSVGAVLDERLIESVISDDARVLAHEDGRRALDHALSDGEDFELLAAVAGNATVDAVMLYPVGKVTASALQMRGVDGSIGPLDPKGYVH